MTDDGGIALRNWRTEGYSRRIGNMVSMALANNTSGLVSFHIHTSSRIFRYILDPHHLGVIAHESEVYLLGTIRGKHEIWCGNCRTTLRLRNGNPRLQEPKATPWYPNIDILN